MQPVEPNRHDKAADAVHEGRPVEAGYVRGGGKGKSMVPVLLISTLGAAAVLFALFVMFSAAGGDEDRSMAEQAADSAVFQGDQPAQSPPAPAPTSSQ